MSNFIRSFTPKNHGGHLSTHKYLPPRAFQIWGFFLDFKHRLNSHELLPPIPPIPPTERSFQIRAKCVMISHLEPGLNEFHALHWHLSRISAGDMPSKCPSPKGNPRMPGFLTIYPLHYSRHLSLFRCRRNESLWKLKYYKQFWCRVKVVHDAWSAFNTLRLLDPGALASKHHSSH